MQPPTPHPPNLEMRAHRVTRRRDCLYPVSIFIETADGFEHYDRWGHLSDCARCARRIYPDDPAAVLLKIGHFTILCPSCYGPTIKPPTPFTFPEE